MSLPRTYDIGTYWGRVSLVDVVDASSRKFVLDRDIDPPGCLRLTVGEAISLEVSADRTTDREARVSEQGITPNGSASAGETQATLVPIDDEGGFLVFGELPRSLDIHVEPVPYLR